MPEFVQVATLPIKPDRFDEAVTMLKSVMGPTHGEPGCLKYALHVSQNDPYTLVMIERWTSPEAVDAHMAAPHLAEVMETLPDMLSEPLTLLPLDPLPKGDPGKGSV